MLAHEKLDVYQCAVKVLAEVGLLIDSMPPGTTVLRDQLERASLSIVANIAEAVGVRTSKERERHFGIARGSAMECGALLDASRLRRACTLEQQQASQADARPHRLDADKNDHAAGMSHRRRQAKWSSAR